MAAARTPAASRGQLLWGAGALGIIVALATASAWGIYGTSRVALVAVVGLLIGAGSVALGVVFRWRWWAIAAVALGGYFVAAIPTAMPSSARTISSALAGLEEAGAAPVIGWKRLLTITLPAGEYQGVLLPFFITVLGLSLAAFALIAYGRRLAPLAVIPLVAMVLFGSLFGSSTETTAAQLGPWSVPDSFRVLLTVSTVAVGVIWLIGNARIVRNRAMRAAQSRTGTARLGATSVGYAVRRQAVGAAIVGVAIVGALVAAPVAASFGPRQVPRDAVDPLLVVRAQPSPLVDYRARFAKDAFAAPLFDVAGADGLDRIRIATLSSYDGETYQVPDDARFYRQPRTQDRSVAITIREGYEGIWVPLASAAGGAPTFGGPRADELADSYYADVTDNVGVVIAGAETDTPGLRAGDSYHVAAVASTDPSELANVKGADPLVTAEDYPQLAKWVELQGVGRTGADLTELIDRLLARGYISHATHAGPESADWVGELQSTGGYVFEGSRAGHSAARVDELFGSMYNQEMRAGADADPEMLVSAIGDDEQFASAAALLAAYLGFDSRVVEGVRLGDTGADLGVKPCDETCTGANVAVWTEVSTPSGTWVVYDTTPQFAQHPVLIQQGQTPPQNPTEPDQLASDVVEPPSVKNERAASRSEIENVEPSWLSSHLTLIITIAIVTVGAGALLLPLFVFPVAKRARRRWRRRNAVPEVAMVGAWLELVDTYVDLGLEVPHSLTRGETADVLGRQNASTLAAVIDRAVFAEHPPTREASDATWDIVDEEKSAVRSEHSWWRRLRAHTTAASLIRATRGTAAPAKSGLIREDRHVK